MREINARFIARRWVCVKGKGHAFVKHDRLFKSANAKFRALKVHENANRPVEFFFKITNDVIVFLMLLITSMRKIEAENINPCEEKLFNNLGRRTRRAKSGYDFCTTLTPHGTPLLKKLNYPFFFKTRKSLICLRNCVHELISRSKG